MAEKTIRTKVLERGRDISQGLVPFLAVLAAFLLGGVLIWITGHNPLEGYIELVKGAFLGPVRLAETLIKAGPLLLVGLGISIAFKNSYWNIGGEGQLIVGAICSTLAALLFSTWPPLLLAIVSFAAGFAGGAIWCLISGLLKVTFNVNEILSTLMLNYIALYLLAYLIRGPMEDKTSSQFTGQVIPQSALIPDSLFLPILVPTTRLHAGIFIALLALLLVWLLWRTPLGFEFELSGANREAAKYAGVNINRAILLTSLLSGGLAGLAGWNEIFGVHHRLLDSITGGYGFLGIVVALLGGLKPPGILISTFLFAALAVGGNAMERATGISFAVVDIINGLIILFVVARIMAQRPSGSG